MGGRTNQITHECLGQNLSLPTLGWKDEPINQQVPWYKIQVLLPTGGRTNQVTYECLGRNLSPSTYRWKDEPSHSRLPWSKFKSSYLRVQGRTKPPASALVKI